MSTPGNEGYKSTKIFSDKAPKAAGSATRIWVTLTITDEELLGEELVLLFALKTTDGSVSQYQPSAFEVSEEGEPDGDGEDCICDVQSLCCDGCNIINDNGACADDELFCTSDICISGSCTHAVEDGACLIGGSCQLEGDIDPENSCRHCDPGSDRGAWTVLADDAECDDGDLCTGTDTCQAGLCQGSDTLVCEALDQCHDVGVCDPETGECSKPAKENGSSCSDEMYCTEDDQCLEGICTGRALDCSSLDDQCNIGECDEENDLCLAVMMANGTDCADSLFCTVNDKCNEGLCKGVSRDCSSELGSCKVASCNEESDQCEGLPKPNDSDCDDDNPCTESTTCTDGLCGGGQDVVCNDNVPCTEDSCIPDQGGCVYEPKDALCGDSIACTQDSCHPVEGCRRIPDDGACSDAFSCTIDRCLIATGCEITADHGACVEPELCDPNAEGADQTSGCAPPPQCTLPVDCDDGKWCTGVEDCVDLKCVPGTPPDCNDNVSCTEDSCDDNGDTCVNTPLDVRCTNNDICDGIESCDGIYDCQSGNPLTCDNNDVCDGIETCDAVEGCQNGEPLSCSNNDVCDGVETCDSLEGCQDGAAPDCADTNVCTDDLCDTLTGCYHENNSDDCNDADLCTTGDACEEGVCTGSQKNCTHLTDQCNTGECNGNNGLCFAQPVSDMTICVDGFDCTNDDRCLEGVCSGTPDNLNCDDSQYCTVDEVCNPYHPEAGADGCVAGGGRDCDDGFDCTEDSCSEGQATCLNQVIEGFCPDGVFCNGDEVCDPYGGGANAAGCRSSGAPDCSDIHACTIDTCNEADNNCVHEPDNILCADSSYCNGEETCDPSLGCLSGTDVDCSALNDQCNTGFCSEQLHDCDTLAKDNGAPCDDGASCTVGQDTCTGGVCTGDPDLFYCDDEEYCNGMESCDPTDPGADIDGCISGTAVDCNYLNDECNNGLCDDDTTACVYSPFTNGSPCVGSTGMWATCKYNDLGFSECTDQDSLYLLRNEGDGVFHEGAVNVVTFSSDGMMLATAGQDGSIIIWGTDSMSESGYRFHIEDAHGGIIKSLSFSPLGYDLASAGADSVINLWSTYDGLQYDQIVGYSPGTTINAIAFSPEPNVPVIASGDSNGVLKIWLKVDNWFEKLSHIAHEGEILDVAFSPNGSYLATASTTGEIKIWDVSLSMATGSAVWWKTLYDQQEWINAVDYDPRGKDPNDANYPENYWIASANEKGLARIWDEYGGFAATDLEGHDGAVTSMDYHPEAFFLAGGGVDSTIDIWSRTSGTTRWVLSGHPDEVLATDFNDSGEYLASGGSNGSVYAWHLYNVIAPYNYYGGGDSCYMIGGCIGGPSYCNLYIHRCVTSQCGDGIDNDQDGYTDVDDQECVSGYKFEWEDDTAR